MNFQLKKSALVVLLAGLLPFSAYAHRNWMLPSATVFDGKESWVTVDAAVSEDLFDFDRSPQSLDGLEILGPDGRPLAAENTFTGKLRSSFDVKLSQPGTYRISLVSATLMASYKLKGETRRWRGTEAAMKKEIPAEATDVKTTNVHRRQDIFLTSGKATDTVLKTSGVGIELQAISHPNDLLAGEKSKFRLLIDGKPLQNHLFGIIPGGVRYRGVLKEIALTTDSNGEFTVTWPQAGMYWLNASYPARVAPAAGAAATPAATSPMPARRLNYSATLEVLPQ